MNIYQQLLALGVPLDHHYSDLYAKKTAGSEAVIVSYEFANSVRTFRNQQDGEIWYDIPFAYSPYWEKRLGRIGKGETT